MRSLPEEETRISRGGKMYLGSGTIATVPELLADYSILVRKQGSSTTLYIVTAAFKP